MSQPVQPVQFPSFVNETPAQEPLIPVKNNSNGKKILSLLALVAVVVIAGIGYFYYSKTPKTYNATVYNQPSIAPSVSPSPSVYQSNPKDISTQAITNDTQETNQNLSNLDSSLNSVDQSLNDQQTNLQ